MAANGEVIALVLNERTGPGRLGGAYSEGAQQLVRHSDGGVSLEDIESQDEFERVARTTGCFRRGKAIRDPRTREIIGYEMEEVRLV